jgi:hypothetical protein
MEEFKTGKVAEGTKPCLLFAGETFADTTNQGTLTRKESENRCYGAGSTSFGPAGSRSVIICTVIFTLL